LESAYRYRVTDTPSARDVTELEDSLNRYNLEKTGIKDTSDLGIFLRGTDGDLYAGLHGYSWGSYCEVRMLWVASHRRGEGIGTGLLESAEQDAKRRGCEKVILSTHSFQAPAFYRRRGYKLVGEIAGCPQGHSHLILEKEL
jgi:N-acetylglutamate synthase-like GNAT family acetyltransferase